MILRKFHRLYLRTIHKAKKRELRTGKEFLHHYPAVTELVIQKHIFQRLISLFISLCHHNALARSQAVILQHDRKFTGIDINKSLIVIRESAIGRGRHVVLGHQRLGEILARLDAGSSLRRSEDLQPARLELIHDTGRQRNLRTDYGQVNAFLRSEVGEFIYLSISKRDTLRLTRYTGIAWCAIYFFHSGRAGKSIHDSMLSSATAYDQNFGPARDIHFVHNY